MEITTRDCPAVPRLKSSYLTSLPGPIQLSVAAGKLGGAWERGYLLPTSRLLLKPRLLKRYAFKVQETC